jgi:Protein of unknown function (DUF3433)
MAMYRRLSQRPQPAKNSILVAPATSAFPGLWRAVREPDFHTIAVAAATIHSKINPIFLSNIPFRVTQTWETYVVCAWMSVSILAFMMAVLLWYLLVKWPHMPVEPNTIAGPCTTFVTRLC